MTAVRPRRRAEAHLLSDLADLLRPPRRARLPVLVWRWRYELALLAGLATVLTVLVRVLGTEGAVLVCSGIVGAFGPWPPWHRPFLAVVWHVITPHRLRAGFAQARIVSRHGRIPVILRTTRIPSGERVHLWCPAGTSAEDLRAARGILRAACWARDIRVTRDADHSQLVVVDVIRRGHPAGNSPAAAAGPRLPGGLGTSLRPRVSADPGSGAGSG